MPLVSAQASPWDSYPFRQPAGAPPSTALNGGTASQTHVNTPGQNILGAPQSKIGSQTSFRDLTLSPSSRGSISSGSSTMVQSRGSLSSLGSIGTMSSRASLASVGSFTSGDPTVGSNGLDQSASMWHNDESSNALPSSSKGSVGSIMTPTGTSFAQPTSLTVTGLPRDITFRECHFTFALATDFVSVEISRNAVSGDFSVVAKFNSAYGAQSASQMIERRTDLFGPEIKTTLQSYSSFVPQSANQRSVYSSRPLIAESHWSQQPATPLSPSLGPDFYSNSRRQSLISPTEQLIPTSSLAHVNLGTSSPSHLSHIDSASVPIGSSHPVFANATTAPGMTMTESASGSPVSSSLLSPTHTGTGAAIGTGAPASSSVSVSSGSSSNTDTSVSHRPSLTSSGPLTSGNGTSQPQSTGASQNGPQNHQAALEHASNHNHSQHHHYTDVQKNPPPNPADQNPPCNTLYVGNLPPDTSESELKELFSQQAGYRRLCFRTKQNGPMCFVEFEDEGFAGKALAELYGHVLSNSVKGGIRLSYSKNPLGVRSRPARR